MAQVRLSRRAAQDLDRLTDAQARRVLDALEGLGDDPASEQLDVKTLVGRRPWRRLRTGSYRVLFRLEAERVVLVARVIHRRELERAVRTLPD